MPMRSASLARQSDRRERTSDLRLKAAQRCDRKLVLELCRTSGLRDNGLTDAIVISTRADTRKPAPIAQPLTRRMIGLLKTANVLPFADALPSAVQ
jgi:hypothetical protein